MTKTKCPEGNILYQLSWWFVHYLSCWARMIHRLPFIMYHALFEITITIIELKSNHQTSTHISGIIPPSMAHLFCSNKSSCGASATPVPQLFFSQEQSVRNCSRSDDRRVMAEILHQLVSRSCIPLFTRFYTSQVVFSPKKSLHHQTISPFSHVQFVVPIFDQIQLAPMLRHRQNVVGTCGEPLATTSALKCWMIFSRMDNAYSGCCVNFGYPNNRYLCLLEGSGGYVR